MTLAIARFSLALMLVSACQAPTAPAVDALPLPPPIAAPVAAPPVPESTQDVDGEQRARAAGADLLGLPVPALTLTTLDGAPIELAKLAGTRPIYLKFWATWCVPCREQMPAFEQIYLAHHDQLEVIAVNTGFSDDEADVRAYRDEHSLHMPIAIDDGRLAAALNLRVTPQHVLIGRDGRISHIGHVDDQRLQEALQAAMAAPDAASVATAAPVKLDPIFKPGDLVHGLTLTTTKGASFPVGASADGRPTAIMFFAPWCESYLADARPNTAKACLRVREEAQTLAATGDMRWLAVSNGLWTSDKDLTDFAATTGSELALALDAPGELFRAFAVRQIPTVAVIAADGHLLRLLGPGEGSITDALASITAR